MNDLTVIKQNGGAYIDSREVAVAIDKPHNDLMKSIRKYGEYLTAGKFSLSRFFIASTYFDSTGRELPCFLLSKMGCEMVANKLTGEKGVLFTAAYVTRFNEMETAEREAEIKSHSKPRIGEFNNAVRNVLNGFSYCYASPKRVINFLRGAYEPFGIEVKTENDDYYGYYSATEIAERLGIYSETGNPHGHAVSAVITKFGDTANHAVAVPYGLIGVSLRYDEYIVNAVWDYITNNGFPNEVPHLNFNYHIYYESQLSLLDDDEY
jgi:Rha family phage regulatory protein